eukprot:CAMPEP_0198562136 /NCGR_PEP_ID=MMETSP1462-20131121/96677_1 /TAXON_ID=1333877 /ORGANISM="Brandtodinium nutriculum, Strain RCC3387" /LENGTH=88 /DNA_ID=CAMNT_0044293059 /DNA_START=11 /DNA_END=274 /DNA_ORIENTATION=-
MKDVIAQAMQELQKKFGELKRRLAQLGVDTSTFDEAMADIGMEHIALNPKRVFDRLYMDALRRQEQYHMLEQMGFTNWDEDTSLPELM